MKKISRPENIFQPLLPPHPPKKSNGHSLMNRTIRHRFFCAQKFSFTIPAVSQSGRCLRGILSKHLRSFISENLDARVMKMLIHDGRNVMVLTDNLSETKQLIRDVMNKSAQNQVKETHVIHLLFLNLF